MRMPRKVIVMLHRILIKEEVVARDHHDAVISPVAEKVFAVDEK